MVMDECAGRLIVESVDLTSWFWMKMKRVTAVAETAADGMMGAAAVAARTPVLVSSGKNPIRM